MSEKIKTGVIIFAALLFLLYINSYILNFIILGVVLGFAFLEALKLYDIDNKNLVYIAIAFYTLAFFTNPLFVALLCILTIAAVIAHIKSDNMKIIAPFVYPTIPIYLIWMLYSEFGVAFLFWLIIIVASSDTGAYFVGKFFGKRSFSPSSPNKTIEGVAGGLLCGTVIGTIYGLCISDGFFQILCTSFLVAFFGIWGDLFESYLKRQNEVKDSGDLFPGHGGMLDRIDGYLFGVVALLWTLSW
ncbi:MAG: phosphatidate cytidylyltransferase [Campylobacter sp.]|nr:phosphatidate cytidylyltransferase [Campylobacter sp.]